MGLPRDVTPALFLMQSNIPKRAGKSWQTESEAIFTFTLPTIEYADTQKISSSISYQTQKIKNLNHERNTNCSVVILTT